jgi:hexosaminidase
MARWEEELMRLTRCTTLAIAVLFQGAFLAAAHNPILPKPQEIQYGAVQLQVKGMSVHLPASPTPEDRFAAQTLAGCLAERTGTSIPIAESGGQTPAIVLTRTGPVAPLPAPGEQPGPESREAYGLKIAASGGEIRANTSAGLFYAAETLCQLVEGQGSEALLPEVTIHDWPSLAYRGTMVDMSHGPLPTEAEVKRQIDLLARWRDNQYYFYSEASIALDGYALLNPQGRFTKDSVRRIIAYGRERHVDVVPCLELYGHLHDLFRVERYADMAALPHGAEFNPSNPKVKALLEDWVGQFAELFPSPFVHIGFDETFQIEMAARKLGAGATPAKLYIEQLNAVAHGFEQRGKTVMCWGDIIVKYPEIIPQMPRTLMAVAWYYDPDDPDYKRWLVPLVNNHVPHFIATGVTSWNQIAPDFPRSFENIDTFLAAGRRSKYLEGLINTLWTDSGQNLLRMTWPGIAYGAVASWQSTPMDRAAFFSDYVREMYPVAVAPEAAAGFAKLAQAEVTLQKTLGTETMLALWDDPFSAANLKRSAEHREDLRQARLQAEDATEYFDKALASGAGTETLQSPLLGARLIDYAGLKFLHALELSERYKQLGPHISSEQWWNQFADETVYQSHSRLVDLMDEISELRDDYRTAWLAEYTPYRLASALGRWDAEYEYWRSFQARLYAFEKQRRDGEALPPLESLTQSH